MCKSSSWAGSCSANAATMSCDGDAATCAIAKSTYELDCLMKPGTKTVADLLTDTGTTGKKEAWAAANGAAASVSVADGLQFGTRDITGSCPAPLTATVMGTSVTVPFDSFCSLADIAGYLVMIVAGFIAIRIVSGGIS